jgi:quercetin dioxygenase-like cupin family protein
MSKAHFPDLIRNLAAFEGAFDAHQLPADGCAVLFASYPAGTNIGTHSHPTRNVGVITQGELCLTKGGDERRYGVGDWYFVAANEEHSARFAVETSEIEFWFDEN